MAERGDRLHVFIERPRERMAHQLDSTQALVGAHAHVTLELAPGESRTGWGTVTRRVRAGLDHLHYFHPRFTSTPDFRARAEAAAPAVVRVLARMQRLRPALARALRAVERAAPVERAVVRALDGFSTDVVVVSPYVWFGGPQGDWTRAAHARGIPVVAAMLSWDNLTSKGSTRAVPDVMTVWNEAQREEARVLHGVPPERVVVTGAHVWDGWFGRPPSRDRAAVLAEAGLEDARALVVYLESSGYVGGERSFAREWIDTLAAHPEERLRGAAVLVRPHPQVEDDGWRSLAEERPGRVGIWPPRGQPVQDEGARRTFFDALYHADAVVGVNTSAFIEAAIVGRPALTPALPQFRKAQEGTVHFAHLLEANGGPVRASASLSEHADQLAAALLDPEELVSRGTSFVERFVRPHGRGEPATPRFVDAVEEAAALSPAPVPERRSAVLLRVVLSPAAGALRMVAPGRLLPALIRVVTETLCSSARRLFRRA